MTNRDSLLYPTLDEVFKVTFLRRLYLPSLNLLTYGDFETAGAGDPDLWEGFTENAGDGALTNETIIVHKGNNAAKMVAGPAKNTFVYGHFVTVVGKKYRLRFWTRGDGTDDGDYQIWDASSGANIMERVGTGIIGTTYTPVIKEFIAPTGCTTVRIYFRCPSINTKTAYFDTSEVYLLN